MNPTTLGSLRQYDVNGPCVELSFERGMMCMRMPFSGAVQIQIAYRATFAPRRSWDVLLPFDDHSAVPLHIAETDDALVVRGASLQVTVARSNGLVSFADDDGHTFARDVFPAAQEDAPRYQHEDSKVPGDRVDGTYVEAWKRRRLATRVRKVMAADEVYYGFGQRIGLLDRRGRILSNWTIDPTHGHNRSTDNMYQAHPVFLALRPTLAWGLYLHSTWYSRFDVGYTQPDILDMLTVGDELDYYVLHGPDPAGVVEKLTRLVGRPAIPPLWSLGFHQSRWGYGSTDSVRGLVAEFRQRELPLDVVHLDIDHMRGYRDFTWNPERFPDPRTLLADMRAQGVRVVTIVDAGVKQDLPADDTISVDGIERGAFVQHLDGEPFVGYCWPGKVLYPDFAREDVRSWWGEQHAPLLAAGVAGIWNDMNEPSIFDRPFSESEVGQQPMPLDTPQGAEPECTVHAETHNLYGLLMCRATYEGLSALRPNERPWILSRSGYTGLQRYAVTWMGDNNSWWEHLEASIAQLTSMGLCGMPHVGVDIGGFFDNATPELYARWIALGAFYPFMRSHSAPEGVRQEPWAFGPEVERIARRFLGLRYRLLPYLYTLAHEAAHSGAPLFRPMMYEFPRDRATYHIHDQAMVGPHLLVAPVYHPGQEYRSVYLPSGQWYDYWTGAVTVGPCAVLAAAPLDQIPLYVRGGAILPLGNTRYFTEQPLTALTLDVYPDGESTWRLIEDDGLTFDYVGGEIAETVAALTATDSLVVLVIEARQGSYQPHPRIMEICVHLQWQPATVLVDGDTVSDWIWNEQRRTVVVSWKDDGRFHRVEYSKPG